MEYVEERNQGLYLSGTRVSLASVIQEFRNGAASGSMLRSFPMIGSLDLVYGAITYCLAHPAEVDHYLTVSPRFQADADLHFDIVLGVLRREPVFDFQSAQERLLDCTPDEDVLRIAAEGRPPVSHHVTTMPDVFLPRISFHQASS